MFVPVHSQDLDFHTTLSGCGQAQTCSVEIQVLAVDRHKNVVWKPRSWLWTGTQMACPQPGPGFPHYMFVPVYSQDLGFYTTFVCLSTARTWISTLIQVLAVDRHKHVVWKSRSWFWTGTPLNVCACPQPGPGFPHYIFVPVHSQYLDFHTTFLCLSTARTWISVEIQVLAVDRHKNVVWESRSWLWTGTNI
jgi:hypothetical protein